MFKSLLFVLVLMCLAIASNDARPELRKLEKTFHAEEDEVLEVRRELQESLDDKDEEEALEERRELQGSLDAEDEEEHEKRTFR